MSKRRANERLNPIKLSLEVDQEQLHVLDSVSETLPPNLKCILPILAAVRKECGGVYIPPHRRSVPVNQAFFDALFVYEKMKLTTSNRPDRPAISKAPRRRRKPWALTLRRDLHRMFFSSDRNRFKQMRSCQQILVSVNLLCL